MHAEQNPPPSVPVYPAIRWRRWLPAMGLGLVCGALVGPLCWFFVWPAQYFAVAYFQVLPSEERLVSLTRGWDHMTQTAYESFQNTQAQTIVNPVVLAAALRDPDVLKLKLDEREDDPITWLQEEFSVTFPGESQIMEVGTKGDDPQEMATIVRAVVNAYMNEVVDRKQQARRNRLAKLTGIRDRHASTIRSDRNNQVRLAEQLGVSDTDALSIKQQCALQEYSEYRKEWIQLQFLRRRAEVELKAQEELLAGLDGLEISDAEADAYAQSYPLVWQLLSEWTAASERLASAEANVRADARSRVRTEIEGVQAQVDELAYEIRERIRGIKRAKIEEVIRQKTAEAEAYAAMEQQLQADLERQSRELEQIGGSSVELEMTQDNIDNLTEVLGRIDAQIAEVEAELQADPQISLLNQAVPPLDPANLVERIALTVCATLLAIVGPFCCVLAWRVARRVMFLVDKL